MSTDTSPQRAKWPTVICVLSVIYTILYAALYVRPPRPDAGILMSLGSLIICLLLLSGSTGIGLRRKWAVPLLFIGSVFVLMTVAVSLFSIVVAMGGTPPIIALLGMLTFMLPTLAWPIFLIFWFSRSSTKRNIQDQWT
jgi:hypothetical protein